MLRCRPSLRHMYNATTVIFRKSNIHTQFLARELDYRGLLADLTTTRDDFSQFIKKKRVVYCGVDPTAASLHIGNLLPLLVLLHFQVHGHHPIALLGGATGLIGDPSGRDQERPVQAEVNVRGNAIVIQDQLVRFFENAHLYARKRITSLNTPEPLRIVNNLDWWSGMTLVDFLHSTGKLARINSMLSKESVKTRLESSSGISFAEFSYQLLQAHDFWHLFNTCHCSIQIGGSDQWGNIIAGLDIIGRRNTSREPEVSNNEQALGITTPLLTTSSGQKFGKSAGNAVWLDSRKTSVFDFYQASDVLCYCPKAVFFLRIPDSEVEQYLKLFTFLGPEKIENIMLTHNAQPELRLAQRELANEITELIHGEMGVMQAQAATRLFFDIDIQDIRPQDIIEALQHDPRYHTAEEADLVGIPLTKLATSSGLTNSRAEANRLIESHGLYLNNVPVGAKDQRLRLQDLIGNRLAILRAGKDKHVVLALR